MHWSNWCLTKLQCRGCAVSTVFIFTIWLGLCSYAQAKTGLPVGKDATADKPQSKAWYRDGSWWCILYDGQEGSRFYRLEHETWKKATFAGALVYPGNPTRADVLSHSNDLYVLAWNPEVPRFYKFRFTEEARSYSLCAGFPVDLVLLRGHETAVLALDVTGVLWVTYESQGTVYVLHSETGMHWSEKEAIGFRLADDDIASIISFDQQVGVFWSNQNSESLHFRVRNDHESPRKWREEELVAEGGLVADDHINLAAHQGWVYAVTKTSVDDAEGEVNGPTRAQIVLNVRSNRGVWALYDVAPLSPENVTRPIVMLDEQNGEVYVFYREGDEIVYKQTRLDKIEFPEYSTPAITCPGVTLNNVTSSKQNVNSTTGLLILATGDDGRAYHRLLPIR